MIAKGTWDKMSLKVSTENQLYWPYVNFLVSDI